MSLSRTTRALAPLVAIVAAVALLSSIFVPTASAVTINYVLGLGPTGNPDGGGAASLEINDSTGEVCYDLQPTGIAAPTAAHIHTGGPGVNGGVLIPLSLTGGLANCVTANPADALAVNTNPNGYYLNIHTGANPGGAVRSQVDNPPMCDGEVATVVVGLSGMATPGADIVFGSGGPDLIVTGAGDDIICGNGGDDSIRSGAGPDTVFGGDGNDDIRGGGGNDDIWGDAGDDIIKGQGGQDGLSGGEGDDEIDGLGAADVIEGGAGNDIIAGQNGADEMSGDAGEDNIRGNTGPDIIAGGDDDDTLSGGEGNDTLFGGNGFDRCAGNTGGGDRAEATSCEQTPGIEILF